MEQKMIMVNRTYEKELRLQAGKSQGGVGDGELQDINLRDNSSFIRAIHHIFKLTISKTALGYTITLLYNQNSIRKRINQKRNRLCT